MKNFVHQFRIGQVRKLFRRVDRRLHQLYPPGVTLVGLLDTANAGTTAKRKKQSGGGGTGQRWTQGQRVSIYIKRTTGIPAGEAAKNAD